MDLMGFVAAKTPDGRHIAITPGYDAAPVLGRLRPADVVILDERGAPVEGSWDAPVEAPLAVAALSGPASPAAVIYGSPEATMRLGAVDRSPMALTHTNAELVHGGMALLRPQGMIIDRERAVALLSAAGGLATTQVIGMGVLVPAPNPMEALRRLDSLELLASMTTTAGSIGTKLPEVSPEQAARISASRPQEEKPSRDPIRYYLTRDPGSDRVTLADSSSGTERAADVAAAQRQLAVASRLLAKDGLCTFFEHVSQRAPGFSDRFLMTPAHDYEQMRADDVGVVGTAGDCAPLDCKYPPAPFRWLHRDMFAARPDVNAIVHTHSLYGRAYELAGRRPIPWHRFGALAPADMPVFEEPSLLFADEDRRRVIELLADGDVVHELHHGTDFVADGIQNATVAAIQQEALCRNDHVVQAMGEPDPLPDETIADLRRHGPTAAQWWDFLASRLDALD
jgi:ribulose-5-phosphate 4-epimerase/fuculose-1-phosphate aldolase